jgi:hypothetical protein
MADIATLGLAVDSSQVTKAKVALDGLTAAAKPAVVAVENVVDAAKDAGSALVTVSKGGKDAAVAVDGFVKAVKPASVETSALDAAARKVVTTMPAVAKSITDTSVAATKVTATGKTATESVVEMSDAVDGLAVAAPTAAKHTDDLGHAHVGLSSQAMAAQHSMRSLVEAMASGQPISQALAQQLNHLSYAATGSGGLSGAFKSAAGSLLGLLSPTALVITGLAAVGAAGYLAISSVANMAKQFDDTSRAIGITSDKLHGLEQAAAFKGIDTADFLKAMEKLGASVYDAQHGMGELATTFRANNVHAKDFNDYLGKAADLIKNASSDQQRLQILQSMGLPATMQWVRYLSQGSEGIKKATEEAIKFGNSAEGQMVAKARAFDEAWDTGWKKFKSGAQSAIVDIAGWLDGLSSKGTSLLMMLPGIGKNVPTNILRNAIADGNGSKLTASSNIDDFYKGTGAGQESAGKKTIDPAVLQHQISLEQQHLGLLGQTATAQDAVRAVELQVQAARLSGVSITNAQVAALKRLASENALGITQIKASTDAMRVEADTIGMSVGQAASYAAAQNAINDARRNGRTLTPENVAQIKAEASALGQAAQNADTMKFAFEGLVRGPMQTFQQQIANGATFFDALKASGVSALNALSSKLMDMAAQNLWKNALGGSSGGGLLSLLGLGGDTSGALNANGSISGAVGGTSVGGAPLIGANAAGTDNWQGGLTRVNEQGGEIMNLPGGTQIIPHDVSMAMANRVAAPAGGSGGGGTTAVKVDVGVSIDQDGNLQAYVKNMSQKAASDTLTGFVKSPAFVDNVGAASRKASGQRK